MKISTLLCFGLIAPGIFLSRIELTHAQEKVFNNSLSGFIAQNDFVDTEESSLQSLRDINVTYEITENYNNEAYEVELNLVGTADSPESWSGSINLPENHTILENYGVLVSEGGNSVNFSGDEWNSNLADGEKATAILIVKGDPEDGNLNFDNYNPRLGEPIYSSFTEADRQKWREEYIAAEKANINATTTPDNDSSPSEIVEDTVNTNTNDNLPLSETVTNLAPVDEELSEPQATGSGNFSYGEALQKNFLFYEANKSGALPENHRLNWRSDSTLNDGADVGKDLTGGYFDAGDHIKFIQPTAFATTMLSWSGVDYKQAYAQSGQLEELLETVKWATDFLLKSHETNGSTTSQLWVQVGDETDHNFWVAPEEVEQHTNRPSFAIDPNNPGSDAAAGTASALASASMLFAGIDDAYSTELLQNAIALYDFAETYLGKYSDSVNAVNPFYRNS